MGKEEAPPNVARRLAAFVAGVRPDAIPREVRERAKLLMLDAVGIAIRASGEGYARRMEAALVMLGGNGVCTVIGTGRKLVLRDAMLMNAALVHGLDYDDTHIRSIVHPTASALPCALSICESEGRSGMDFVTAYVLGVELLLRIASAAQGRFNRAGFHPTGLTAHFSCALQAGWLYGLGADELAAAQGIALSTASGTQEFLTEGTWNKRLHPGWACVAGLTAARFAQQGFNAVTQPYEGRYGLYRAHLGAFADEIDYGAIGSDLGQQWLLPEVAIKPYPICHMIHACADVALALRAQHGIDPRTIRRIEVRLPAPTLPIIAEPREFKTRPRTEYEASFSVQYVVAACLARGRFGFHELEPECLADPEILELASKVEVVVDEQSPFPLYFSGGVQVETNDGASHGGYERVNRGTGERALGAAEIIEKFHANVLTRCGPAQAQRIRDVVLNAERHAAAEIAQALRSEPS